MRDHRTEMMCHPGDSSRGPVNTCGAYLRGGVILCDPGDNSHFCSRFKNKSSGVLHSVGSVLSYVGVIFFVVCGLVYFKVDVSHFLVYVVTFPPNFRHVISTNGFSVYYTKYCHMVSWFPHGGIALCGKCPLN